jgi:5-methylcytosine-specific restriction endonuclease McrA
MTTVVERPKVEKPKVEKSKTTGVAARSRSPKTASSSGRLGPRLDEALSVLSSLLEDLDPDRLTGADAATLYGSFARAERLAVAGKTLLAPRIDASGVWKEDGHRNCAVLLSDLEGVSPGSAGATLARGRRLEELPGTEEALRKGGLSAPKLAELVEAGSVDPQGETRLLDGAEQASLASLRDRCRNSRAQSSRHDPLSSLRRIHRSRRFSSWTDAEGAFCFAGRDSAARGALLTSRLNTLADSLRAEAKAAGEEKEPEAAFLADAFFALVTGDMPGGKPGSTKAGAGGTGREEIRLSPPSPPSVLVRVDVAALRRGVAKDKECCEIDGSGPIPVAMARDLLNDSSLRILFHRAGDIRAVSTFGRTIPTALRVALEARDPTCVVPGCEHRLALEIDHVIPLTEGGPTSLANLARLCHHHHFLKTYDHWELERTGTDREGRPTWSFSPPVAFGREPDLGIDTKEGRDRWRRQRE